MNLLKALALVAGSIFAVVIAFWVLVCVVPSCCGTAGDDVTYAQGPCLDGYIWNQKKDECI